MASDVRLSAGDKVLVGASLVEVDNEFAQSIEPGDVVLGVAASGALKRIPRATKELVSEGVQNAFDAFSALASCTPKNINVFFE